MKVKKYECFKNLGFKLQDGSGLKVTKLILKNNVNILFTRKIGTKAYSVLMKEHIDILFLSIGGIVSSAIKNFYQNNNQDCIINIKTFWFRFTFRSIWKKRPLFYPRYRKKIR